MESQDSEIWKILQLQRLQEVFLCECGPNPVVHPTIIWIVQLLIGSPTMPIGLAQTQNISKSVGSLVPPIVGFPKGLGFRQAFRGITGVPQHNDGIQNARHCAAATEDLISNQDRLAF